MQVEKRAGKSERWTEDKLKELMRREQSLFSYQH
jgi:hypothetical protein